MATLVKDKLFVNKVSWEVKVAQGRVFFLSSEKLLVYSSGKRWLVRIGNAVTEFSPKLSH